MQMITPPENQGQMVEVSYGWHDGRLYRRTYDRSDRAESWDIADEEDSNNLPESWCAVNGGPGRMRWEVCDKPGDED